MKAIILLAGLGTRLRPHTYSKPKPLLNVAGKTVLGHILDGMSEIQFDEIVFIVGYLGDQIEQYIAKEYPQLKVRFVEQKEMKGQAHAIWLAKDDIDEPVLIVFGDTIWETDWSRLGRVQGDGLIYVREVQDPRRFGVVTIRNGYVSRFVEKPQTAISNLAVVGVYYFKNWQLLVCALDQVISNNIQTQGEYYLADAMQWMVEQGAKLETEVIPVWEDCGTREALLKTNRYLLSKNAAPPVEIPGALIVPPVFISPGASIHNSIVGPFVSISEGASVEDAIVRDCIVSEDACIENVLLESSLVGKDAHVHGTSQRLNVGDSSEVEFSAINGD